MSTISKGNITELGGRLGKWEIFFSGTCGFTINSYATEKIPQIQGREKRKNIKKCKSRTVGMLKESLFSASGVQRNADEAYKRK